MILVTGAGGFLGRNLVSEMNNSGRKVIPLYHNQDFIINKDSLEADLTLLNHIEQMKALSKSPNTVVHLAGKIGIEFNQNKSKPLDSPFPGNKNISQLYMANVISTANILEYCLEKGVKHLIYASSQTVYGMPKEQLLKENLICNPLEHYASSKLCAEQLLRIGSRQGLAVTILRFPGIYGEERKNGIVYQFCKSAKTQKNIKVVTQIPLPLDVIHVNDVIEAIKSTIEYGGNALTCLNISTGEPCNVNILASNISKLIPGCKVELTKQWQPIVQMDSSEAWNILHWKSVPCHNRLQSMLESIGNDE